MGILQGLELYLVWGMLLVPLGVALYQAKQETSQSLMVASLVAFPPDKVLLQAVGLDVAELAVRGSRVFPAMLEEWVVDQLEVVVEVAGVPSVVMVVTEILVVSVALTGDQALAVGLLASVERVLGNLVVMAALVDGQALVAADLVVVVRVEDQLVLGALVLDSLEVAVVAVVDVQALMADCLVVVVQVRGILVWTVASVDDLVLVEVALVVVPVEVLQVWEVLARGSLEEMVGDQAPVKEELV